MGGEQLAPFLLRRNTPPLPPPSVFPLCYSTPWSERGTGHSCLSQEVGAEQDGGQPRLGRALSRIGLRQPDRCNFVRRSSILCAAASLVRCCRPPWAFPP